jgi:Rieske Fe-S protein
VGVIAPEISRRRFLLGAAALTVAVTASGCREQKARKGAAASFLGDEATSGSPLWADDPGAYIVAIPDGEELPREAVGTAPPLLVLSPVCSNDQRRVGWCVSTERFVCPNCRTVFTITGSVESGPAPRGLDRLRATVNATTGELTADSANPGRGPDRDINTPNPTPPETDAMCTVLRFPASRALAT